MLKSGKENIGKNIKIEEKARKSYLQALVIALSKAHESEEEDDEEEKCKCGKKTCKDCKKK